MAVHDIPLPPALALLWGRGDRPRRGPKPTLSLDTVVHTAIEIADTEGITRLSMARVAERLGFTTMSLYRYVRSKDDLLLLMDDAAHAGPPPATPGDWRGGLTTWARGVFDTYRRHPWLLQIPVTTPPAGPAHLAWMEAGLQNLRDVDLDEGYKLAIIQLVHGYVRGEAQLSTDVRNAGTEFGAATYGQLVRAVTDADTHPALTHLVASGALDEADEYDDTADFAFGLTTILDGVAQRIGDRGRRAAGRPGGR